MTQKEFKQIDIVGNFLETSAKKLADKKSSWPEIYRYLLDSYCTGWNNAKSSDNVLKDIDPCKN